MEQLSKSKLIVFFTFSMIIIAMVFFVGIYAVGQRQNNYDVSISISPNIKYSIEIAKVNETNLQTPTSWVKIFDNSSVQATVSTSLVNIIDGKIVFQNSNVLGSSLTSEDVLFFRIKNLTPDKMLKCELANTGTNGYSFTTSETTNVGGTEYLLYNIAENNSGVFYVCPNAWYQNMTINIPLNVSVD